VAERREKGPGKEFNAQGGKTTGPGPPKREKTENTATKSKKKDETVSARGDTLFS